MPGALINRRKEGFNAPISNWLLGSSGLKMKEEVLDSINPVLNEILDPSLIESFLKKNRNMNSIGNSFFGIYVLNKFLNKHN